MGTRRSQQIGSILILGGSLPLLFTSVSLAQNTCDLPGAIAQILDRPEQRQSQWGIAIQDAHTEQTIYEHNGDQFFVPASALKLLTTAAALELLGADYQFQTPISLVRHIHGDVRYLVIEGKGDPTLTTAKLRDALATLQTQGITAVEEVIILDSPPSQTLNSTWEWSDLPWYYATAVNRLILNENTVEATVTPSRVGAPVNLNWSDAIAGRQWRLDNQQFTSTDGPAIPPEPIQTYGTNTLSLRGSLAADAAPRRWFLSVPDPGRYALETVQLILREQGITYGGGRVVHGDLASLLPDPLGEESQRYEIEPLTAIASPPLAEIIKTTNQDSNNLFAETLLKTLQTQELDLTAAFSALGIEAGSYRLRDGSGLSRHNLVTPTALVQALAAMDNHTQGSVFRDSLAIAGRTGTLQNRFQNTPVVNQFFGKTGTMTHVSTLTGYLDLPNDNTMLVGIMANQTGQPASITRQAMDEIVVAVHDWQRCTMGRSPNAHAPN
ncbi:D-alanyl-D-alanine carboxypeptidase/D-alanyl-D-alanine-endopeptidase [[Synechococcus] sp. NIES-970]|nr:D-alanyl-D-alanine carboxypeptidase/D-alanyl-D-alanine-endopeptidase [[Synechococcus] sp. NIES-970]